jgi:hypothetical protein
VRELRRSDHEAIASLAPPPQLHSPVGLLADGSALDLSPASAEPVGASREPLADAANVEDLLAQLRVERENWTSGMWRLCADG